MFIRKIRSQSKRIAILVAILFVGMPALGALSYFFTSKKEFFNVKKVALTIDGKRVYDSELDSSSEFGKILTVTQFINNRVIKKNVSKLHIYVSNDEVKQELKNKLDQARNQFGKMKDKAIAKRAFNRSLKELKDAIKQDLLFNRLKERVINSQKDGEKIFRIWFAKERALLDIKYEEGYEKYGPNPILQLNSLYIMNYDFANTFAMYYQYAPYFGIKNNIEQSAAKLTFDNMTNSLLLANEAINRGYTSSEESMQDKIQDLKKKLESEINEKITVSRSHVSKYFKDNRDKYDTQERAEAYVVYFPYRASDADAKSNQERANAALKKAISTNALEGKVLKLSKKEFSNKFGRRFFRANEVVPSVILSGNMRVVAKEKDNMIEYVVFEEHVSEESKARELAKAKKVFEDISSNALDIAKAMELYSDVNFKKLKNVKELSEGLRKIVLKSDKAEFYSDERGLWIVKRDSYIPYKAANLDDLYPRLERECRYSLQREKMEELNKELSKKYTVEVKSEYLKSLLNTK